MNTKIKLSLVLTVFLFINAFSQSNFVKIDAADKYYLHKDYANAALLYSQVANDTAVVQSRVLPYKIQMVNLSMVPKGEKKANAASTPSTSTDPKDSTAKPVEPVQPKSNGPVKAKPDTTVKAPKEPDPKTVAKYDYVLHRLASSYFLNADYNNAALSYKKCVDRNVYPDSRYFYALSLMTIKRYQEALNEFETYVSSKPENDSLAKIATKKEAGCFLAMDTLKIPREIKVKQFDTLVFNKGNCSFGPSYYGSATKVIFTSARKGSTVVDPKKKTQNICVIYT